jgi:predicted metal-dependent HD superfamily phosphohydrolase/GNAT superfamily N-acetyltransferase
MEPQRHYHTLVHLDELLRHLRDFELSPTGAKIQPLSDKDAVLFALFFHDIVYDPTAKDNEEQSATLFTDFAAGTLSAYILQTKTHMNVSESAPFDLRCFLDMDLAILGAPKERYLRYADEIRAEYRHVPHDLFCKGRGAVLRTFLGHSRLYKTAFFHEKLEVRARTNLQWEITRLRSPELSAVRLTITDTAEIKKLEGTLRRDSLKLNEVDATYCIACNMDLSLCFKDRTSNQIIAYVLTTVVDDETVGYSMQQRQLHEPCGKHLLLHSLVTLPEQRHRGLALALVNTIITLAADRGISRITTWCPKGLVNLFLPVGFVQVREVLDVPCIIQPPSDALAKSVVSNNSIASNNSNSSFSSPAAALLGPETSVTVELSLNLCGF